MDRVGVCGAVRDVTERRASASEQREGSVGGGEVQRGRSGEVGQRREGETDVQRGEGRAEVQTRETQERHGSHGGHSGQEQTTTTTTT